MNAPPGSPPAIEAAGLSRSFGAVEAVRGIDLTVRRNEIFGFLGPNGAGKSTTISMLTTLLRPTAGRAVVAGHDVRTERDAVRRNIGLVFQATTLDDHLTAERNLRLHAELYAVPRDVVDRRLKQVLDMVGLWDRRRDKVAKFSGGMKRRLEIARGLLHTPAILFLDEPTVGLDPQTRNHIWSYLKKLNQDRGLTIFFTTHYMDEVERTATRVAIIDHGKLIADDSVQGILQKAGTPTLEEAFIKLTGHAIRHEEAGAVDQFRNVARMWGRR